MKRIFLFLVLFLVLFLGTQHILQAQQTSWQWVNPLPQGNAINGITAMNKDTAFAVANNGTIIKTTNGGKTWQVTPTAAGITEAFYNTQFVSKTVGWAVGEYGKILKTTDAGNTWFIQYISTTKDIFTSDFISESTGWIAGAQGMIYKTTDGGTSWAQQNSGLTVTLYGMFFLTTTTGWAVGTEGKLIATTDGGNTWVTKTTNTVQNLYNVQFISSSVGYAVGTFGMIIKSTNGGNTWVPLASGIDYSLYGLQFTSPLIGYATGSFGVMIKTTNGGFSWFEQTSNTYNDLYGISFSSSTTGWATGDFGTIVATTDGGVNWISQSSGTKSILDAISFSGQSFGIAVGEEGTVVLSQDGGTSWAQQTSGVIQTLYGVHMINNTTGWAVGDSAVIIRTTTGGGSWTEQNSHTDLSLYSVFFISPTTGWAVGDFGTILNTINGGLIWKPETSNVSVPLMRIKFYNSNIGWAVGYGGEILKTIDGGHNWISQVSNTSQTLYGIDIVDENTVYASGDFGSVVSTTDGGNIWTPATVDGWASLYGITFINRTTGWAVGDDGTIVKTTDLGATWSVQNSGTQNTLWDVLLVKTSSGGGTLFAAGQGGTLICSAISPLPTRRWTGSVDSLWTSPANWIPVGVPEKGDSVYIPVTANRPVLRSLLQQINIGGLRIDAGAKLTIGGGLAQLAVSGTIKIDGTLDIEPTSSLEIITGDNLAFGTYGSLNPAKSTFVISNNAQLRGSFFNMFITNNAVVQSLGNITIKNNLTLQTNISLRQYDTLTIQNPDPQGFQGVGFINGGTIKRAINQGASYEYRFESQLTYVKFHPAGTLPDTVLMTSYPNTLGPGLSDTVFVKRYYSISAIGGSNYLSQLSLRYDTSETSIPIDYLGLFRDSSGIIFNMGVSNYLDSDVVAISLDSVSKFSIWYIGRSEYYWKHPQQFMDSLTISDNGSGTTTLIFGAAPGATDGIDPYWQEVLLAPKPSLGFFDARWSIPATNGTDIDIRDILSYTHQQITYTCTFQPGSAGYPFTLNWDNTIFPFGNIILRDGTTHGVKFSIDMRNQNSLIITDPTVTSFEIVYNAPSYYLFNQGWNMVSIPVNLRGDNYKTTIFPTAISSAFGFTYQYYSTDTLANGCGYWVKFIAPELVPFDGTELTTDTFHLNEGWNMIGSISSPVPISTIQRLPSNMVLSDYYSFTTAYVSTDSIKPSKAYWVKTNLPGNLILTKSGTVYSKENNRYDADVLHQLNTITIADKNGGKQILYFGEKGNSPASEGGYELPPLPPNGIFDARFSSQQAVEFISDQLRRLTIDFQTEAYPVTVSWDIKQSSIQSVSLIDISSGRCLNQSNGSRAGSVQISNPSIRSIALNADISKLIPKDFSLKQNYPNPFNPSTVIEFALPSNAVVNLKVYNLLGQEVSALINDKGMEAGNHQIEFDSGSLKNGSVNSSGLYFYRISAKSAQKNYVEVRKMLLLK